jgi:hypothetical protein
MTEQARDVATSNRPSRPPARSFAAILAMAFLTLATQIVLRRELAPGEFGTLNALLGALLVALAPMIAFSLILRRTFSETEYPPLLRRAALAWGAFCLIILFAVLPGLELPRASLTCLTLLASATGLLALCARPVTSVRWCLILGVGAALVRFIVSAGSGSVWPSAESGLGALVLACILAGLPALRNQPAPPTLADVWTKLQPNLIPNLATISVVLALALFSNADRIAAQRLFAIAEETHYARLFGTSDSLVTFVNHPPVDDYQAAGLLIRYLLLALAPLLFLFHARRSAQFKTTRQSLHYFWIYLVALIAGLALLAVAAPLVNVIFSGYPSLFMPGFIGAGFALGLLQAVAIFALASSRHIECFVLAACSVVYTGVIFGACHLMQLLPTCMFAGALLSLMIVLFTGVVRYARTHP